MVVESDSIPIIWYQTVQLHSQWEAILCSKMAQLAIGKSIPVWNQALPHYHSNEVEGKLVTSALAK